jgi:phosphoribosyl 1,2-cyclic phosphodiesterase
MEWGSGNMGQVEIKNALPLDGEGALSAEEIAEKLGANVGTTRVYLTHIRNKRDPELVTHIVVREGVSMYAYARRPHTVLSASLK